MQNSTVSFTSSNSKSFCSQLDLLKAKLKYDKIWQNMTVKSLFMDVLYTIKNETLTFAKIQNTQNGSIRSIIYIFWKLRVSSWKLKINFLKITLMKMHHKFTLAIWNSQKPSFSLGMKLFNILPLSMMNENLNYTAWSIMHEETFQQFPKRYSV